MITTRRCPHWIAIPTLGMAIGCRAGQTPGPAAPAAQTAVVAGTSDDLVARLTAERDDAVHRALDARKAADADRGNCQLVEHQFDSMRERDSYEDAVWSRLEHADIDVQDVRQKLEPARGDRKRTLEGILRDADTARGSIERSIRRVRTVSDLEWPRLKHDIDSDLEGLDRVLRSAR